jgi:hypothetical protein
LKEISLSSKPTTSHGKGYVCLKEISLIAPSQQQAMAKVMYVFGAKGYLLQT